MASDELISIIIPAYNAETTLTEALDSITHQTYPNFEAVIVDDGSTDNTARVAKQYSSVDSRFRYYYQENSGVSAARNKGIELSTGQFVCFLDADDYFEDTYLERMYSAITGMGGDVCYCGYNYVLGSYKRKNRTRFKNGNILLEYILGKIKVHTTGWLIKKTLLTKNQIYFPEGVSWGEDFEFFCEVLASTESVFFVREYLTNYRIDHSADQLSAFSLDKIDRDFESIMRLVNNGKINTNKTVGNALLGYRLQALITYKLIAAINQKTNITEIRDYYVKYREYISKPTFNNGLRSVKLILNKIVLRWSLKDLV